MKPMAVKVSEADEWSGSWLNYLPIIAVRSKPDFVVYIWAQTYLFWR